MTRGRRRGNVVAINPDNPFGSFEGEGGYDIDTFYVGAKDAQGHSSAMKFKIPDNQYGAMETLLASREIREYQTLADFPRDAISHRIIYLAQTRGTRELTRLARMIRLQDEIELSTRVYEEAEAIFDAVCSAVTKMATFSDHQEIKSILQTTHSGLLDCLGPTDYARVRPLFEARIARLLFDLGLNLSDDKDD